jgi:hypothetical protein
MAEKIMWMTASIISVILPILHMILLKGGYLFVQRDIKKRYIKFLEHARKNYGNNLGRWEICYYDNGFPYAPEEKLYSKSDRAKKPAIHELIGNFHVQLVTVRQGLNLIFSRCPIESYDYVRHELEKLQRMYELLLACGLYVPLTLPSFQLEPFARVEPERAPPAKEQGKHEWSFNAPLCNLLNHPERLIENYITSVKELRDQDFRFGRWCYVINGAIYGISRVTILVLAFVALRDQNERLYEDS